jgi:amino acid adenylation domain-containing protein
VSQEERARLVTNARGSSVQVAGTVLDRILEAARRSPDSRAVVAPEGSQTYGELVAKAEAVARWLGSCNVGPEDVVAVTGVPSVDLIVALVGIWRAGACYLPLDPATPEERLRFILRDSRARAMLVARDGPMTTQVETTLVSEAIARAPQETELRMPDPSHLAYLMYTSGTSGQPKGALIEHRSVASYVAWFQRETGLNAADRGVLVTSFAFDLGYTVLWTALATGAELHLVDEVTRRDPSRLLATLADRKITYVKMTPSLFGALVTSTTFADSALAWLRLIVLGGEPIDRLHVATYLRRYTGSTVMNHYGPTETTIGVVTRRIRIDDLEMLPENVPIGRPIAGASVYALDENGEPCPVGVAGEITVGGAGVARGYLARPDLEGRAFVSEPRFEPTGRLYRTGDVGRWLPSGELQFLGRRDRQVKIRGHRVELADVESAILKLPGIRQVAVVVGKGMHGDRVLSAYVVAEDELVGALRTALRAHLPDYMVPTHFVRVASLPVTPNGKLDEPALAKIPLVENSREMRVGPRTELECRIAEVWSRVLGTAVDSVDVKADFFASGGHSLLAMMLVDRLRGELDCKLELSTLFAAPTIEALAMHVGSVRGRDSKRNLVCLVSGGASTPLFCVHAIGGTVYAFADLAKALRHRRPVYGLQSSGLPGTPTDATVEEMAARYILAIKQVQPKGPYCLSGWSMGGLVALEMARQLESAGEAVALVALFDTYVPRQITTAHEDYLIRAFARDVRAIVGAVEVGSDALAGLAWNEKVALLGEEVRKACERTGTDPTWLENLLRVFSANKLANDRYVVESYGGRVLLFAAVDAPTDKWPLVDRGWDTVIPKLVTVDVRGDHFTILSREAVASFVTRLDDALERATVPAVVDSPLAHAVFVPSERGSGRAPTTEG